MAESVDMDGSFSFLNDNEYHFELEGRVQGRIARLNGQMARIYFVSALEEVSMILIHSVCAEQQPSVVFSDF